MIHAIHILFIKLFYLVCFPLHSFKQKLIHINGFDLWVETFGKKENPALLLIMGCGAPGLLWHQKFCEQLADKGFFVIRYDHRDVGLSSKIDYEKAPYTLLDMAEDAVAILDHYAIQKAHIVGGSMGGVMAMLFAAHFPDRVSTLTLMMTTPDGCSTLDAIEEKPSRSPLSPPHPAILEWIKRFRSNRPQTLKDKQERFLEIGRIQNGSAVLFDEKVFRQLALQSFLKTPSLDGIDHHLKAWKASCDLHQQVIKKMIKVPTLIIHGDQDPIFPLDHAAALKQAIPHAQLAIIPGMGHGLNTHFYTDLIEKIENITKVRTTPRTNECT